MYWRSLPLNWDAKNGDLKIKWIKGFHFTVKNYMTWQSFPPSIKKNMCVFFAKGHYVSILGNLNRTQPTNRLLKKFTVFWLAFHSGSYYNVYDCFIWIMSCAYERITFPFEVLLFINFFISEFSWIVWRSEMYKDILLAFFTLKGLSRIVGYVKLI